MRHPARPGGDKNEGKVPDLDGEEYRLKFLDGSRGGLLGQVICWEEISHTLARVPFLRPLAHLSKINPECKSPNNCGIVKTFSGRMIVELAID